MMRPLLLATVCVLAMGAGQPELKIEESGLLRIGLPAELFNQPETRRQLASGLTTTLLIEAEINTSKRDTVTGRARLDIRYEPWDEVFYIHIWHGHDRMEQLTQKDLPSLLAWLSTPRIGLCQLDLSDHTARSLNITLDLVPFSQREQHKAQQWFSKTVNNQNPRDIGRMLDVVFAASIKRKATSSHRWRLDLTP